jgi:2-polyprenyl-6-methoxyphenol hydroxylase-like FAD-dependent oxidoreductase
MAVVERVLIVGGGLGGTTLSLELQRRGITAEIIERDSVWGARGTGITLMGPALRAMHKLGILDECLPEGYGVSEMHVFTGAGELLERVTLPSLLGDDYPAMGGMMRPTLHRVLSTAALDAGASVRTGLTVTKLIQRADAVEVEFTDGTRDSYDLVVGADGWRSSVRRMLLGDSAPEPEFLGLWVWRALVDRPKAITGLSQFYGHGHKTGFTPLTPDEMYMFLVEPNQTRDLPPEADRPAIMRELLSDFGGIVAEVRETIVRPDQVDVRPLDALILPSPWHRGRVALIGDAAHATTPQLAMGGAIALEDAIVMAEELADGSSLPEALDSFMARRFDRCKLVVDNSVQLAEWEKNADEHSEEAARLQTDSFTQLAAPI